MQNHQKCKVEFFLKTKKMVHHRDYLKFKEYHYKESIIPSDFIQNANRYMQCYRRPSIISRGKIPLTS